MLLIEHLINGKLNIYAQNIITLIRVDFTKRQNEPYGMPYVREEVASGVVGHLFTHMGHG